MTYYDVQMKASDGFGAETTAMFPPVACEAFFHTRDAILAGRLRGEQVDHLVWRASVTNGELDELISV